MVLNKRVVFFLTCLMVMGSNHVLANDVKVSLALLTEKRAVPPALSNLDPILTDEGIQGATLGIKDNNTTGQFTGHHYDLKHIEVPLHADVISAFNLLVEGGYRYILVDVQASTLEKISALAKPKNILLFNVSSTDDRLRNNSCSAKIGRASCRERV